MKNGAFFKDGINVGSDHCGIPNIYFALCKGGTIVVYEDAHIVDSILYSMKLCITLLVFAKVMSILFICIKEYFHTTLVKFYAINLYKVFQCFQKIIY